MDSISNQSDRSPRRMAHRKRLLAFGGAVVVVFAGVLVAAAVAQGTWRSPGFGPRVFAGTMDPAQFEDRADRIVRHVAIELDATGEQQERLRAIVKAAVRDLVPLREKGSSARERARLVLTQPSVDRAALEQLRVEQLALIDSASKRISQALGDMSAVLSVEQRRSVDDRMRQLREEGGPMWAPWRRG